MSVESPEARRFLGHVIVWAVVIALMAIPASIGVAVAMATKGRPLWDARVHAAIGLLFLAVGLSAQMKLAAYGPKSTTQNRVQTSVMNSAIVLLGVTQLANDSVVGTPLAILALALVMAGAFRRPRRFF
jgi:hypothetical protein